MMAAVSDLWVSWFSCCVAQPQKRTTHRIDRSMIGNPTNFQHTGHIGSRDVEIPGDQLIALQNQMKSKGGYETTYKEILQKWIVWLEVNLFSTLLFPRDYILGM